MGAYDGLIFAVNATAGVLLAVFFGLAAGRLKPRLAHGGRDGLIALVGAYALLVLFGMPLHPLAALIVLAFGSAAWAAAPLHAPTPRARQLAAAMGLAAALLVSVYSAFDLWWTIPLLALALGFLRALWQARPDFLRKPEDRERPPQRIDVGEPRATQPPKSP